LPTFLVNLNRVHKSWRKNVLSSAVINDVRRKQQFENQLLRNSWKVKWEDIEPVRSGKNKGGSTVRADDVS